MSGTREGGRKTAQTNIKRHGSDFYAKIGAKGGSRSSRRGVKNGQSKIKFREDK